MERLGIHKMPRQNRLELAHAILATVEAEPPALSDELIAEIRQRVAEAEADPDGWMTWEDAKASLDAKYPDL